MMAERKSGAVKFDFTFDPTGQELVTYPVCSGATAGTYTCRFHFGGKPPRIEQGDIESPRRYTFALDEHLRSIDVTATPIVLEPVGEQVYKIALEQNGRPLQETDDVSYDTRIGVLLHPILP